ncbi:LacI family DNA-binding transcriptional regulator [Flavobacterium sp. RHBU_24]|uniref:LacI family DNA-binding transcriptional regulator n=1 Tax=Flavobacterium sp. RHBU_24 TaxID=3391185 RepID=UPI00398490D6
MKKKQVSLKSIAEALNTSSTTVSFILNGKAEEKHISAKLTKKVLDYVAEINYQPNQLAKSLRTGRSNILVFMVEDISNSFFSRLARVIEDIAYKKGYKVIFCSNENDDNKSIELINLFTFRQVDGFIIVPSPGLAPVIKKLVDENIPVILLDRYFEDLECNIVVINNKEASYEATMHLIKNGYKNIVFITTDTQQTQMLARLEGYKQAVQENALVPQVLFIPFKDTHTPESKVLILNFLKNAQHKDAVFFATNYLTLKALEALKKNAPELTETLGMVTFDDNDFFSVLTPTITAVSQPLWEMGNQLMELMLNLLKTKDVVPLPKKIVLDAELVVRNSSISVTTR